MRWKAYGATLMLLFSALDCSSGAPSDAADAAAAAAQADAASTKPNVIFILTDDLSWNLVKYMPHVKLMQQRGMTFSHYYVTDSLCCPSRSSIFTGKFPHDTQVFTNTGNDGGYAQFERMGNASQTWATTLRGVGYRAGMMGKYLNGYDPATNQADPGWTEWDVAGNGYPEYNYTLNENGTVKAYGGTPDDYLVDVLAGKAVQYIMQRQRPFALEVATFAPHAPYTPAPRNLDEFAKNAPRLPNFNTPNVNPPIWLSDHGLLTPAMVANLDTVYNLRVEAVQSVDDMINQIFTALTVLGLDKNTYVFFSSDNGYHLGEHTLPPGKMTIFDTDINVPLIVVGPDIPAGVTVDNIVENIDLCPTFADLAGTAAPVNADGHSLVPLLTGQAVTDWRDAALIEHHGPDLSPMDPGDPDNEPPGGPPPNSYEAIRLANSVYAEYQNGDKEYYDLTTDPYEMTNTFTTLTADQAGKLHSMLSALQSCHGTAECWAAAKL